jgi:hypothetical protein
MTQRYSSHSYRERGEELISGYQHLIRKTGSLRVIYESYDPGQLVTISGGGGRGGMRGNESNMFVT